MYYFCYYYYSLKEKQDFPAFIINNDCIYAGVLREKLTVDQLLNIPLPFAFHVPRNIIIVLIGDCHLHPILGLMNPAPN
jgi:hypothetical protein